MSDALTFDGGRLEDVIVELQQLGDGARQRLMAAVVEQAVIFEQVVITDKLSGQVLNQVSGRLVGSVFQEVSDEGDRIMGTVSADTPYSRIQEYGGVIEPVNASALRFQIGDKWIFAHRVVMPERSYLRSTLEERADTIRAALLAAVASTA